MHFERLTPALGATVHGFTRAALDDPSTFDKLHAALMEHQVLFVDPAHPDQTRAGMTNAVEVDFCR